MCGLTAEAIGQDIQPGAEVVEIGRFGHQYGTTIVRTAVKNVKTSLTKGTRSYGCLLILHQLHTPYRKVMVVAIYR
jgi:hypothetical protein